MTLEPLQGSARLRQKADELFARANAADTACDHDLADMLFRRGTILLAEASMIDAVAGRAVA